jgi:hypothetical protein
MERAAKEIGGGERERGRARGERERLSRNGFATVLLSHAVTFEPAQPGRAIRAPFLGRGIIELMRRERERKRERERDREAGQAV